ncbi:MAG TPA: RsmB/NOP family class I SAM-dependent RNA methyltransferase [Gammaproteobacteria bacterium]|nr:RsmB/NOP family class I SAM-dependent RNA methyltransferase [Gammaproteobacteria bacterium]
MTGRQAADQQMQKYFRERRHLGMRERGFIAETVYGCLRRKRMVEHLLDHPQPLAHERVAAYLLHLQGWSARALLDAGYPGDAAALTAKLRDRAKLPVPDAIRADLPDWIYQSLVDQLGPETTLQLAEALHQPAPVDLRVNTLKAKREQAASLLAEEGYATEFTPLSPVGLRRMERVPLFKTRAFQEGWIEIQDEGSQLLALLLEPARREMVVDFCAGAGGKTLHIGALMGNTGSLYAFDTSAKRLENMRPRLKRSGLDTVRPVVIEHERDRRVQRLRGKIDRVLVDAPCTGIGTLRRNPDIKWRNFDLEHVTALQGRILAAAADLLKPGGRLVYATCSPLRAENEDIVQPFLDQHPDFKLVPVAGILAGRGIILDCPEPTLRLYPHIHNTDAFFAAVIERAN